MRFRALIEQFHSRHILVVGDLMLDEYIVGKATRISPEAPVMVVRQNRTFSVPGGAANVAKNVEALGAKATVIGAVGEDQAGTELQEALGASGNVIPDPSRPTTRKTRVLADTAHQVLRIDHESEEPIDRDIERNILATVQDRIGDVHALVLSDYRKGVLTRSLVGALIEAGKERQIPIIANAKPSSIAAYKGASLVSVNAKEAAEIVGVKDILRQSNGQGLVGDRPREVAQEIRDRFGMDHVLVTLGEYGMCTEEFYVAPQKVEVFDTAGAGDTTIATVALGLATMGFDQRVFELASQTAAAVVRHVGVAVPSPDDLERIRLGQ